jgi:hypothetical protein
MLKKDIIEICRDRLSAGVADKKIQIHDAVLEAEIELVYNAVIHALCLQAIHFRDVSQLDHYIKRYDNVAVVCDTVTEEYYSILPSPIIQLPNQMGIRSISPLKDKKINFIFRENGENEVMEALEFAMINQIPTYYVEHEKVFYDDRMTVELAGQGVKMKLIVPFSSWDDDDVLTLPAGKDIEIAAAVVAALIQKYPEDTKANSRSDLKVTE